MTTSETEELDVYDMTFDANEIKVIRWSLEVAASAVAGQSGEAMPQEDAMTLVAWLTEIDARLVNQVHQSTQEDPVGNADSAEESHGLIEGQLSLWPDSEL